MRVLIGVDIHHSGAAAVVHEGTRWAQALNATLDVAFVDEYEYSAHLIRDPSIRAIVVKQWEKIQEHNRAELGRLLQQVPEPVRGAPVYLHGRAADRMIQVAEGYDAVLVATHGRTGLQHFFLGSVAERIVRNAKVPVVVLRLPEEAK